jgi:hypothetical protein
MTQQPRQRLSVSNEHIHHLLHNDTEFLIFAKNSKNKSNESVMAAFAIEVFIQYRSTSNVRQFAFGSKQSVNQPKSASNCQRIFYFFN